ncbi:Small RNA 2'-O-methyltransferase, partial [Camellia lanceoleosa]
MEVPDMTVKFTLPTCHYVYSSKVLNYKKQSAVDEASESIQNESPGLAIPQKGPCLYRCCLQLPEFSVVSETFKRKKDAEQSAAEMALLKLGINAATDDTTVQDPRDELAASRLSGSVSASEEQLSMKRENPYPPEIVQSVVDQQSSLLDSILIKVVRISYLVEKTVEPLTLNVASNGYYLDIIAQELGLTDASKVLVSRASQNLHLQTIHISGEKIRGTQLKDLRRCPRTILLKAASGILMHCSSHNNILPVILMIHSSCK